MSAGADPGPLGSARGGVAPGGARAAVVDVDRGALARAALDALPPPFVSRRNGSRRSAHSAGGLRPRREARRLIVWSSDRAAAELYLIDLPGQSVRQPAHDPHVDFFPVLAGRAARIFLRSQREW
jgi:hypothetical protein